MENKKNRERETRIVFYVNQKEDEKIKENMAKLNIKNRELYLRKMATDGYILDMSKTDEQLREIARLVRISANNINQVAKRANETGSAYEQDVLDLKEELQNLTPLIHDARNIISRLVKE